MKLYFIATCTFHFFLLTAEHEEKRVSFNFENSSLETVLKEIEKYLDVSFIYDEQIADKANGGSRPGGTAAKGLKDTAISFRTNKPFSQQQIWNIVDAFLGLAQLARTPVTEDETVYRITPIETAAKEALPVFIGTEMDKLPDSGMLRYVYFLKNSNATQMTTMIKQMQGKFAQVDTYQDLNALLISDHAYNIKAIMQIVHAIDASCNPISLSVLKLKQADATEVAKLYETLKGKKSDSGPYYGGPMPPQQESKHFLQQAKVFAEPRTNTLIILGPPNATKKIEQFITTNIDTKLIKQRSKLHTIALNYVPAESLAEIFNKVTTFGEGSQAAQLGSIRGGEKFFNKMFFEAEKQSNQLIVRGEEEDFVIVKEIVEKLDKQQPQVALEVVIVNIENKKSRGLFAQLHNKNNKNANFQTSDFAQAGGGVVLGSEDGKNNLIGDLIKLATGAPIGSTVITLGKEAIWAILGVLSSHTKTNIISNPFLVTTNKYPAAASLGETRRVQLETVTSGSGGSQSALGDVSADLEVKITPQINAYGMINLDITVKVENFTDPDDPKSANKSSKTVHTNANVGDGELLALGGLIKSSNKNGSTGNPLRRLPLVGRLFENRKQELLQENLIIFIVPRIVNHGTLLHTYTHNKATFAMDMLHDVNKQVKARDPIMKWMFSETDKSEQQLISTVLEANPQKKIKKPRTRARKSIQTSAVAPHPEEAR